MSVLTVNLDGSGVNLVQGGEGLVLVQDGLVQLLAELLLGEHPVRVLAGADPEPDDHAAGGELDHVNGEGVHVGVVVDDPLHLDLHLGGELLEHGRRLVGETLVPGQVGHSVLSLIRVGNCKEAKLALMLD